MASWNGLNAIPEVADFGKLKLHFGDLPELNGYEVGWFTINSGLGDGREHRSKRNLCAAIAPNEETIGLDSRNEEAWFRHLRRITFDVRGGRSRRRREPKAQLWAIPLDGRVRPTVQHLMFQFKCFHYGQFFEEIFPSLATVDHSLCFPFS